MDLDQQKLFDRIASYSFDDPQTRLTFAARLARENGWSLHYAQRALQEYKRFCFLAMAAGHPVTPSEEIDQVWHLHLVYTRKYWQDFCPNYLGQPLHHGPTKGGPEEHQKHDEWYRRTLESYHKFFQEAPPLDLWPASEERFGRNLAWKRVNWKENWIIPKRQVQNVAQYAFSGLVMVALVGCGAEMNPLDWKGPEFLGLYAELGALSLIWCVLIRALLKIGPVPQNSEPDLTDYEVAYLQNGPERVFITATAKLNRKGCLGVDAKNGRFIQLQPLPADASNWERAVYDSHLTQLNAGTAQKKCQLPIEEIRDSLIEKGLILSPGRVNLIRWLAIMPFVLLLLFGLTKIFIGVERGKPVGILIGFSIATLVVTLINLAVIPRNSRFGNRFLKSLKVKHSSWNSPNPQLNDTAEGIGLPVALFGAVVLAGGQFEDLGSVLRPLRASSNVVNSSSNSSSGCSSSDGGGGGDGGGGCGGCGGGGD